MASILASFDYLKWQPLYEKQKPYEVFIPLASFGEKKDSVPRSNLAFETHQVSVQDVRGSQEPFKLDTHGFQFAKHTTTVQNLKNRIDVAERYVPEMEAFIQHIIGKGKGVRTHCFDLRLRGSVDPEEFSKRTVNLEDGFDPLLPATHPHVDQSASGAIRRVQRHCGDEANELLRGRVRIINIWRPLRKVKAWPLALCDAKSVRAEDLVACDIVRRRFVGETCFGKHSPGQKWYYLSDQDVDEVVMLKIYDSSEEPEARFCLHCSFPLEDTGIRVMRESIEIRMLVFTES